MSEPVYYPDMLCHLAPLRPKVAPLDGCDCRVCRWLRGEPIDMGPEVSTRQSGSIDSLATDGVGSTLAAAGRHPLGRG